MAEIKRLEFPCTVSAGRDAARALKEFLAAKGYNEDTLFACELSLTEACNNAVQHYRAPTGDRHHGGPSTDGKNSSAPPIIAEAITEDATIELRVTDSTPGFHHPGTLPPPEPDIKTGRGLFLIQSMMDEVRYERGAGRNVLIMKKRVSAP